MIVKAIALLAIMSFGWFAVKMDREMAQLALGVIFGVMVGIPLALIVARNSNTKQPMPLTIVAPETKEAQRRPSEIIIINYTRVLPQSESLLLNQPNHALLTQGDQQ